MDLRQRCMDYMAANKDSFASFIVKESSYESYIKSRRNDGVWGCVCFRIVPLLVC